VLSVTTGTWTGTASITYAYQVTRNGTPVGAPSVSQNYTIPDADLNALFGCIVTATNSAGDASAAAALLYVGVMDVLSVQPAVNYELRRESRSYTGLNKRVRRSSDNAEANFGFATAAQTRTNLSAIPINNNAGATAAGVTMTTVGTGTEFGQPYIDVRWQGTSTSASFLQFIHDGPAAVTPGLNYTTSVGFRLVSGAAPSGIPVIRSLYYSSSGFLSGPGRSLPPLTSVLQRGAIIGAAPANAVVTRPSILIPVNNGEVVNATIRYYATNVEQAIGNARPLLQHNVPETVAAIGELDAEALLNFVGNGDGFITILHDKSGNGRNATQTTPDNQPRIVSNGAIVTENGRPVVSFDGNDLLNTPSFILGNTVVTVARRSATNQPVVEGASVGSNDRGLWGLRFGGTDFTTHFNYGINGGPLNATNADGFPINVLQIVSQTVAKGSVATTASIWAIGHGGGGYVPLNGFFSGLISLPPVLSTAERQLIERNRGAYYGIPIA
jgi:hypothetical protein